MTCSELKELVNKPYTLSTRSERLAARRHVQSCRSCFQWSLEMAHKIDAETSIGWQIGKAQAIADDLTTDPEAI